MIQQVTINDKQYPLLFSFRAVFSFMDGGNMTSIQEADNQMSVDFDSMLELYEQAFKKGAYKDDSFDGDPLSAEDIEDALDEDPTLFVTLQELFAESNVIKSFNDQEGNAVKK